MKRRWIPMILSAMAATTFGGAACGSVDGEEVLAPRKPLGLGGGGAGGAGSASWSGAVQPTLIEFCSECHNPTDLTGGVDLTSYAALGAKPDLVVAGDPDMSLLVQVLEGGIMPPVGRPRPSPQQIAAIRAWIAAAALDN